MGLQMSNKNKNKSQVSQQTYNHQKYCNSKKLGTYTEVVYMTNEFIV